ncbi:hypothetical protein [Streptomyces flaveolus]|uniref:hypothetical protein n=1 Tax=Streptomyces flaveolus TaxID=67297 RepID=UPI0033E59777
MPDEFDDERRELKHSFVRILASVSPKDTFFAEQLMREAEATDPDLSNSVMRDMADSGVLKLANPWDNTHPFNERQFSVDHQALSNYEGSLAPPPSYAESVNDQRVYLPQSSHSTLTPETQTPANETPTTGQTEDHALALSHRFTDILAELPSEKIFFADQLFYEAEVTDKGLSHTVLQEMAKQGVLERADTLNNARPFGEQQFRVNHQALDRYMRSRDGKMLSPLTGNVTTNTLSGIAAVKPGAYSDHPNSDRWPPAAWRIAVQMVPVSNAASLRVPGVGDVPSPAPNPATTATPRMHKQRQQPRAIRAMG